MRSGRKILVLAVALVAIAFAIPAGLGAQSGEEQIREYDIVIEIENDGDLLIVEEIVYDFGPFERRGIFRDIRVRYHYDDEHERVLRIHDVRVSTAPGVPSDVKTSTEGDLFRIRIGDPDVQIRGTHQYRIAYRVEGVLDSFEDHVELNWNAVSDWPVPVGGMFVSVTAPVDSLELICFAGPSGSVASCDRKQLSEGVARFEQATLRTGEALTVAVALPLGSVEVPPPILETPWSLDRAFSRTPLTLGGMAALALLAIGIVSRLVWTHGRDQRFVGSAVEVAFGSPTDETQRVPLFESPEDSAIEFAPPENMQPGLMGTLVDETAHPLDVTATVIDLAVRGYLTIEEIPKEGWFGKEDWRLMRLRETDDELIGYEQRLLDGIFRDGNEVLLSDLKTEFVERLKHVQDDLYKEVVDRSWFRRRPDNVRDSWVGIGVAAAVVGGLLTAALAYFTSYALLGPPIVLGGVLVTIKAGSMPRRTAKGTGMMRRAIGFQRALATAEADTARWAEQQGIFSKYLPYAVVFGLTERWAKAFEGLDEQFTGTAGWYVSSHPFTTYAFAASIGDFSTSTAGTIVATPASSGGSSFGGGGFAGGGFGGGGGGSW